MPKRRWEGLILAFLLAIDRPAAACSCEKAHGKAVLANAAVFGGKVLKVEFLEFDQPMTELPIRVTFEIEEVWKGPVRRFAVLHTVYNDGGGLCSGYGFRTGIRYLVAAREVIRDEAYEGSVELGGISLCGGTSMLPLTTADWAELGTSQLPR